MLRAAAHQANKLNKLSVLSTPRGLTNGTLEEGNALRVVVESAASRLR